MEGWLIGVLILAGMLGLIFLHVPIGIAMAVAGVVGFAVLTTWQAAVSQVELVVTSTVSSLGLIVIPLFLLMGSFAAIAGLSGELYRIALAFLGHFRGGLAMATIGACAGFGAICGSSIATVATMTRVALPEMLTRGYSRELAAGSIAGGGSLGILIPPSILMVVYGILTEQSVITLFVAGIVPGIVSVILYFLAIAAYARVNPGAGPRAPRIPWPKRPKVLGESWAVILMITLVTGGLYAGALTLNEAAALGAILSVAFAFTRGRLKNGAFWNGLMETASSTGMIYVVMIGAWILMPAIAASGLPEAMVDGIRQMGLPPLLVIFMLILMYLALGAVFDAAASMIITLPFVFPLIMELGFHPIWWGIVNIMVIEIALITPPIGINVFLLQAMAKDIPLRTVYRGILPFFIADLVRLAILVLVPQTALWLPGLFGMG